MKLGKNKNATKKLVPRAIDCRRDKPSQILIIDAY